MKKPRNTTGKGYFEVKGSEPLAKLALSVRVPESMDAQVRRIAGGDLSSWLRSAIAEKLEREMPSDQDSGSRGKPNEKGTAAVRLLPADQGSSSGGAA